MNRIRSVACVILLSFSAALSNANTLTCRGIDPPLLGIMAGMDWNNIFPITFAGIGGGPNVNPPQMWRAPTCVCPSRLLFGAPIPGLMLTFWEPLYIAEVERDPGCSATLGGRDLLSGYDPMHSGAAEEGGSGSGAQEGLRRQIHWFQFPVMEMLDLFKQVLCTPGKNFDIGWITELDPIWQSDPWSVYVAPESLVVANPIAGAACSVDALASNIAFPMDSLFWCAGSAHLYPLTGNMNSGTSSAHDNMTILARFLARQHRIGALMRSIGPQSQCFLTYDPFLPKQQYRIDPVFPWQSFGAVSIYPGKSQLFWGSMPTDNPPGFESTTYMLWRAAQCCVRL